MKLKITPCLWFNNEAEEAARFYTNIFPESQIDAISRYGETGQDIHGRPAGSVMTISFRLNGHSFTALNGGPHFKFTEAISFQVECDTQEEIDFYWDRLNEDGDPECQQCGWLKDKFGLSWQIVPSIIATLFQDHTSPGYQRTMQAMLQMKKLDIATLKEAYAG
jgi:predicted 3-demethylubiquinone-9 3-methyltransferase (glyoxalase superfamily)